MSDAGGPVLRVAPDAPGHDAEPRGSILVVGAPRSGTTILFEALAAHPELGWLSNYSAKLPWFVRSTCYLPRLFEMIGVERSRARKPQDGGWTRWFERFLPRPDEAYSVWERVLDRRLPRHFLVGERPSEERCRSLKAAVSRWLEAQGRRRFVAKLTGPGRINYLSAAFDQPTFVHVVRDGRAVVHSLLNVEFWRRGGGFERPWWGGGLDDDWRHQWESHGKSPAVLAALQWRAILEWTRREATEVAADRWLEVRYEDFVADPIEVLRRITDACGLARSESLERWVGRPGRYQLRNPDFRRRFSRRDRRALDEIMGPLLRELGYEN